MCDQQKSRKKRNQKKKKKQQQTQRDRKATNESKSPKQFMIIRQFVDKSEIVQIIEQQTNN